MRWLKPLVLWLALVLAWPAAAEDWKALGPAWSLERDGKGVKVWTQSLPGKPVKAFRATTTVKSTVSGLLALFLDFPRAPEWIDRARRVEMLTWNDERREFHMLVETDLPFPVSDRDSVVFGRVYQDPKTGAVTVSSSEAADSYIRATPAAAAKPGVVRMRDVAMDWVFMPKGRGLVEVTMVGTADPAGYIPPAIVNLLITEAPYNTLVNLRRVIVEPRYQERVFKEIVEPAR